MDKKIVLLSQGAVFMVDALVKNLKNAGFDVTTVEPYVEELDYFKVSADLFLIFAGKFVYESPDIFTFIKDVCISESKPLCVIGYDKEIEEIEKSIPEAIITKKFLRPFDMRSITEELNSAIADGLEKNAAKHILLVDDDGAFLKMMQGWLSMQYRVTIVNSGMQAITYLAVNKPDLILLDFDMPITPGPQVLEMIRSAKHTQDIPVIFLTGKSDRASVESVLRLKPEGYLLKTMGKEEIVNAVDHFFATKKWSIG